MAKRKAAVPENSEGRGFNPASLSKEQQEAVVEEYLGYHPKYFIFEGLAIRFNHSQFEFDERQKQELRDRSGVKGNRKWFDGWRPRPDKFGRQKK
jgi:hypothetical protein